MRPGHCHWLIVVLQLPASDNKAGTTPNWSFPHLVGLLGAVIQPIILISSLIFNRKTVYPSKAFRPVGIYGH